MSDTNATKLDLCTGEVLCRQDLSRACVSAGVAGLEVGAADSKVNC